MANPAVSSTKSTSLRTGAAGRTHSGSVVVPVGQVREFVDLQIERALEHDELELLLASIVALMRRRRGKEAESLKAYVFEQMLERLDEPPSRRRIWPWVRLCAARPEVEARQLACVLLSAYWKDHRKDVERLTLNLARDEDAEVRQYAASTMSRIVRANFRLRLRYLQAWSRHPDPSVRRQVIIATVGVADPDRPERAKHLLNLLEPHLKDRDPYVRRNLGPFALGQGLLRAYPEATVVRFKQWLEEDDEGLRWNLAIALEAADIE